MAYISTEEVKEIRNNLKEALGKEWKLSVTRKHMSTVNISVMSGPVDMPRGYMQVNEFYIKENFNKMDRPDLIEVFNKIKKVAMKDHWDKSDSMTDYFHCSFYVNISVGKYDKPYVKKAA